MLHPPPAYESTLPGATVSSAGTSATPANLSSHALPLDDHHLLSSDGEDAGTGAATWQRTHGRSHTDALNSGGSSVLDSSAARGAGFASVAAAATQQGAHRPLRQPAIHKRGYVKVPRGGSSLKSNAQGNSVHDLSSGISNWSWGGTGVDWQGWRLARDHLLNRESGACISRSALATECD